MHRLNFWHLIRYIAALLLIPAALAAPGPVHAQSSDDSVAYQVETLNSGLPEPPDWIDRSTPRATMQSLITAERTGMWAEAAHLMNLNGLPPGLQAEIGAELASKLTTVIRRKTVVDWTDLLDRPDALDARASDRSATAGMARKSILLWTLDLGDYPAALRLNRLQPENGEPVWVFSRQTVDAIEPLYARYGPSQFEAALPGWLRKDAALGLMRWEWFAMPILIAVAVLIGLVVRWGLDAAARVSDRRVVSEILRATRGPAIFGAVTAIVSVASSTLFVFSGRIDAALDPLIAIGITASVLWLFVNAIDVLLDRLVDFDGTDLSGNAERTKRSVATKVAAARRALIVIAVAIGAGTVLTTSNLLQNLGLSILGTAGALTLILAFAARRVLGNIMSSLQIALNQSARIGDRIVYKDHLCHVERINFTFVQLRDWDGTRLVVPVEDFVSEAFENWTMQEPEMLRIIKIKMAHGADVEELRTVFDEVIEGLDQEELGDLDKVKVRVADQDVFGKDVWFCLPCADPNTSWDIACQAREEIIARAAKREETGDDRMFPEANPAEAA